MTTNSPQITTTDKPLETKPHHFTWRQKAFITEYAVHRNPTDAVIKAGYSKKCAREQFHKLLKNVWVASEINRIEQEAVANAVLSREKILEEQSYLALNAKNEAVRARVLRDLGEIQGMYIQKIEDITKRETVEEAEKKTIEILAKFKGIDIALLTETIEKLTRTTKQGSIIPQNKDTDTLQMSKMIPNYGKENLEGVEATKFHNPESEAKQANSASSQVITNQGDKSLKSDNNLICNLTEETKPLDELLNEKKKAESDKAEERKAEARRLQEVYDKAHPRA